jgi:hypothetical protein
VAYTLFGIDIFVLYTIGAGLYLTGSGIVEVLFKERAAYLWSVMIQKKYFFLYGLFLTLEALPLTGYDGYFSPFVFSLGAFFAVMGPVIFLYPNILVKAYSEMEEVEDFSLVVMVKIDGTFRVVTGVIFLLGALITLFM